MGCGPSNDPKVAVADSHSSNRNKKSNNQNKNGFKEVQLKNNQSYNQSTNQLESIKPPTAFVISFDDDKKTVNRPPPGRLRLEPLNHVPKEMTQAQIETKMRAAEVKREKILADRAKSGSKKKTGRLGDSLTRFDSDSQNEIDRSFQKSNGYRGNEDREQNNRAYENQIPERDESNRQRLLQRRRIMNEPDDLYDDNQSKNYKRNDDYQNQNRRRYS